MVSLRSILSIPLFVLTILVSSSVAHAEAQKKLAYIVSDISIPFWDIMSRGIQSKSAEYGYDITVMTAENSAKNELANTLNSNQLVSYKSV